MEGRRTSATGWQGRRESHEDDAQGGSGTKAVVPNPTPQIKVKLHIPSQPRGAAPHPRRVSLPLNAGTSPLGERDVLSAPSNDTSSMSVGFFFFATHEGPPPDLDQ